MKHWIAFSWFMIGLTALQAQIPNDKLLDKGVYYFEQDMLDSAIYCWERVLVKFTEKEQAYGRAMLNLGVAYTALENEEMALKWYNTLLLSDVNDLDIGFEPKEDFASYKHNACMRMATIYAEQGDYAKALDYTQLAAKKHTYHTSYAGAFDYRNLTLANWQAEYYKRLNMPDSSLHVLLQAIFDREIGYRLPEMKVFSTDDYTGKITGKTLALIDQLYGREKFLKALDKALEKIKITETTLGYKTASFSLFKMDFILGTTLDKPENIYFIDQIKATEFYKQLTTP